MEYIKEHKPAYDEYMNSYDIVVGLRFDNRDDIDTRFIENTFVDEKGNQLEIELPRRDRIENDITIEKYEESYEVVSCSLSILESHTLEINNQRIVISFSELLDSHELKY